VYYALIDPGFHRIMTQKAFGRGAQLIPPGQGTESLIASMKEDGILPEQVRMIILTHGHPDHVDSCPWWREQFGIPVALHAADLHMYQRLPYIPHASWRGGAVAEPELYLEEGNLALGDNGATELQITRVPGHSPGSVALYHTGAKALFTGDVLFYRMIGRADTPNGNIAELSNSVRRLSKLDIEYLLPGHSYLKRDCLLGRAEIQQNFDYIISRRLPTSP
jgi:glyoxylase-like metal-dependent hydrolase (beta-lactamase superfamily II)